MKTESQKMRTSVIIALALLAAWVGEQPALAQSSSTTIYNERGQIAGTAERQGSVTTFRDGAGRMTGTAERLPDGRIETRDAMGRMTGTTSAPRQ
jgi:YD repeat-containing protein